MCAIIVLYYYMGVIIMEGLRGTTEEIGGGASALPPNAPGAAIALPLSIGRPEGVAKAVKTAEMLKIEQGALLQRGSSILEGLSNDTDSETIETDAIRAAFSFIGQIKRFVEDKKTTELASSRIWNLVSSTIAKLTGEDPSKLEKLYEQVNKALLSKCIEQLTHLAAGATININKYRSSPALSLDRTEVWEFYQKLKTLDTVLLEDQSFIDITLVLEDILNLKQLTAGSVKKRIQRNIYFDYKIEKANRAFLKLIDRCDPPQASELKSEVDISEFMQEYNFERVTLTLEFQEKVYRDPRCSQPEVKFALVKEIYTKEFGYFVVFPAKNFEILTHYLGKMLLNGEKTGISPEVLGNAFPALAPYLALMSSELQGFNQMFNLQLENDSQVLAHFHKILKKSAGDPERVSLKNQLEAVDASRRGGIFPLLCQFLNRIPFVISPIEPPLKELEASSYQ